MSFSPSVRTWRERGGIRKICGHEVFLLDSGGGGVPLVLLHGFPTCSYDFHLCFDALATARRVVTLDFVGFGFSAKPTDFSYSLVEQADVVEVALRELGIAHADLFAHDMGTSVATELVARRAAGLLHFELGRLALMNGSVHVEMAHLAVSQKLLRQPLLGPLFARLASRSTFRAQLRRILGRRGAVARAELDDLYDLIRHNAGHLRLPATIGYVDERRRFARRWIGALETLDRPMLVLWGARDPVAVMPIARKLASETPGARLVTMEDLGHYPQLEDPARVARELNAFFS
jgi:pimeloyl-ACP methyl ester carboxylesterase